MAHAVPKSGDRLATQDAPGCIGDGAADDQGQALTGYLKIFFNGKQRGFGVEGVEYGFDQQHIGATFDQRLDLFKIRGPKFFKRNVSGTWVIDIRADAGRFGCGPQGAHHKPGPLRGRKFVASSACQPGRGEVHFPRQVTQIVICLGDCCGTKGIGFDQIRPCCQVGFMNILDHLRAGDAEQITVVFDIFGMRRKAFTPVIGLGQFEALDHGAHGTVQNRNAARQQSRQGLAAGVGWVL